MTNPFVIQENAKKIKDSKVLNYHQKSSAEIFSLGAENPVLKLTLSHKRLALFFILSAVLMTIFLSRLFYLQIWQGDYWLSLAEGNRIRIEKVIPVRGIIFDRNQLPLIDNQPNFVLSFIPADLVSQPAAITETLNFLSQKLSRFDLAELRGKIETADKFSFEPVEIKTGFSYDEAINLILEIEKYPGLRLNYLNQRKYLPEDYGSAHWLGYLGKINQSEWQDLKNQNYLFIDWLGKSGLEKEYESVLRGQVGLREVETDAQRRLKKVINEQPAKKGSNLILSIDAELNRFFSQQLCGQAKKFNNQAAGLALDPRNGEILAMVSCPTYNNNYFNDPLEFSQEIVELLNNQEQSLFNRSIQGEYPPGSIFKLIVAAAGLEEGIINQHSTFNSIGGIQIQDWFFPDWKTGGHGLTNLTKALAESVNTFFYYVGGGFKDEFVGLGMEKMVSYAKKFGLSSRLGIDLPDEKTGFLPSRAWKEETAHRPWYIGDTYHLSIGQGDLTVTPLQVAVLTSFYAKGGILYQPHLVKAVVDQKNIRTDVVAKILKQNIIDQDYVELIKQGLHQAVVYGSARFLNDLPVSVAGKTGTAQVAGGKSHAWFTGFAPYENPEIVVTVLVENGGEGSVTAVPVAKEVFNWYFGNK